MTTLTSHRGALDGLRIVDLAGTVATAYAGKLFADYGAQVINLEGPEGAPTRRLPPLVPGSRRSALHGYLNANKLSVTRNAVGVALTGADLVLVDDRDHDVALPDSVSTCSVTWFGPSP